MGERKLRYDDVKVGDQAPTIEHQLTRTDLVMYAGASGDFNPMHHDDTIATSVGNPSVFGHGMLTAGLMARVLKDWFGPTGLRRFQVRFAKQVWPGDTLTCRASVTATHADEHLVDSVRIGRDVTVRAATGRFPGLAGGWWSDDVRPPDARSARCGGRTPAHAGELACRCTKLA